MTLAVVLALRMWATEVSLEDFPKGLKWLHLSGKISKPVCLGQLYWFIIINFHCKSLYVNMLLSNAWEIFTLFTYVILTANCISVHQLVKLQMKNTIKKWQKYSAEYLPSFVNTVLCPRMSNRTYCSHITVYSYRQQEYFKLDWSYKCIFKK